MHRFTPRPSPRRLFGFTALAAALSTLGTLPAQADVGFQGAWGDQANGTYVNNILPGDYSDIDAIRVGNHYYMISSTMQYSPGMVILQSEDLVNWTLIGHVVNDLTQIAPKLNYTQMNYNGGGIWAGSIRYYNNKFWVYFGSADEGYWMSSATSAAGPWAPLTKVSYDTDTSSPGGGWDDSASFRDDDGSLYLIGTNFSANYTTHLFRMTADGTKLVKSSDIVIYQGDGAEANKLFKYNGYYYIFHSKVSGGRRNVFMLRSRNIWGTGGSPGVAGTYEEKQVSISLGNDKEPNQGGLIQLPSGQWVFVTHHGSMDLEGRPASLLPVTWVNDWPVIGTDTNNDTVGEMTWSGNKPIANLPVKVPQSSDDFNTSTLSPQWEWQYQPRADKWSLTERPGYLRLRAFLPLSSGDMTRAGNTLTQRFMRTDSGEAVVKMDVNNMADGQEAGFAHMSGGGARYYSIGVVQSGSTRSFKFRDSTTSSPVAGPTLASSTTTVWLRSVMNTKQSLSLQYSLDGINFTPLGGSGDLVGSGYRGDRLSIYSYNNLAEAGFVDVDSFSYAYAGPAVGNVSLYLDGDYGGSSASLALGDYTLEQLRALGVANDSVSSIKVAPGYKVVAYQDGDFTGSQWTYTADAPRLTDTGNNDLISSVRISLDPNSFFRISNRFSTLAIDGGASTTSGATARQNPWSGGAALQWRFVDAGNGYVKIVNHANNFVLDAGVGTASSGSTVIASTDGNATSQMWRLVDIGFGYYKVVNRATGLALDGASSFSSADLVQKTYAGAPTSVWRFSKVN